MSEAALRAPITKPRRRAYNWDIPVPDPFVVAAVLEWLVERRSSRRPPGVTARLLATIVEMHERSQPFPPRELLVKSFNQNGLPTTTDDSIDAARSAALYNNEIFEVSRTAASQNMDRAARTWVVRDRYYEPCPELRDAVRNAKRRLARVKRDE